jgi:hypothetical protein
MSKMTMRKRISLTVVTALTVGSLSATAPSANAHGGVVGTSVAANAIAVASGLNTALMVAEITSQSGAAVVGNGTGVLVHQSARSLGLLTKDTSTSTAQTATMLTSGVLSLYANIATAVSLISTGGTFGTGTSVTTSGTATYDQTRKTIVLSNVTTGVGVLWTAPSTAGTYTISMYNGASGAISIDTPTRTLVSQITVTAVAASAGGSYSAANSVCSATNAGSNFTLASNADGTTATTNGNAMYINFALKDAYGNALDSGNIVATATNGALIAYSNGATAAAGTASTVVAYDAGSGDSIRVNQATANTPISTTVTISYNGTTICTKTVGIAGEVAKIAVTVTDTQNLSTSAGKDNFLEDGYARAGLFTVLATDAGGNQVATSSTGVFALDTDSLLGQTIVTDLSVTSSATQTSTTLPGRLSTGTYTCGANAGEVKTVKLKFTNSGSGKVISSDAFTVRCAGNPVSYTVALDKASYVQGDIATVTAKFLDSKGNAANSVGSTGSWTSVLPMLTNVAATGSATTADKSGVRTFTYTVGTNSGITSGTYTGVIDFTTLTAAGAVRATPTYKVSTGGDTTTNADVLKSIVALIASINKQIQALQKLILKR